MFYYHNNQHFSTQFLLVNLGGEEGHTWAWMEVDG